MTIQRAFESAKAEHSDSERALTAEASPDQSADTPPDEATAQPPVPESAAPETDLISDDEFASLQAKHKDDADALRKELKAVFTKKTQTLAEERKKVEALGKYAPFVEQLDKDAVSAIKHAAQQLGLTVSDTRVETKATETATKAAETMADDVVSAFRSALGPDLEFLADKLAPAIQSLAQNVAKAAVGQAVEPLKSAQEKLLDQASKEQSAQLLQSFTEKRPDWKSHEPAMMKVAESVKPAEGVDPIAYLDILYTLATKDIQAAEATKKVVQRLTKGAKEAEGKAEALPESRVNSAPAKVGSIREAYELAKRGQRVE